MLIFRMKSIVCTMSISISFMFLSIVSIKICIHQIIKCKMQMSCIELKSIESAFLILTIIHIDYDGLIFLCPYEERRSNQCFDMMQTNSLHISCGISK